MNIKLSKKPLFFFFCFSFVFSFFFVLFDISRRIKKQIKIINNHAKTLKKRKNYLEIAVLKLKKKTSKAFKRFKKKNV